MHPNTNLSTHKSLSIFAGRHDIDATLIGECIGYHESTQTNGDKADLIQSIWEYASLNGIDGGDIIVALADFTEKVDRGEILGDWR